MKAYIKYSNEYLIYAFFIASIKLLYLLIYNILLYLFILTKTTYILI